MKETILLIEDEIELQQNLKEILEYNGFSILTADNGQEALSKVENHDIDLFLCDIMMPGMDGFQFLKRIRSQARFETTPFIFLSAKTRNEDKSKGYRLGANDYLTKPISARLLLNSIFGIISKRQGNELKPPLEPTPQKERNRLTWFNHENSPVLNLIHHLQDQKKQLEDGQLRTAIELNSIALASAELINSSFSKLYFLRNHFNKKISPTLINLDEEIQEKLEFYGRDKFVYKSNTTPIIYFDRKHLKFILSELIENALKFNLEPSPIEIELKDKVFSIKNAQSIFQPGENVRMEPLESDWDRNKEFDGLGVGLFLVSEYCLMNHSSLKCLVDSNKDFRAELLF
jgi:two-component system, sensor histidine kinase and response regulator